MEYLTIKDFSEKWGITPRRIAILCTEGRIPDVKKVGYMWLIPENATKPADNRKKDKGEKVK